MKTHRFNLARWLPIESEEGADDICIDWPSVHRQAGLDHIQWLKSQSLTDCQLVVESKSNDPYKYLIAEIYSDKLATMYSLMWDK